MIIQPTIPYHLMGISYTAVIEVVTTTEEYAFILRTMYFHVAEMISNYLILSAFGLKSLFTISKGHNLYKLQYISLEEVKIVSFQQ